MAKRKKAASKKIQANCGAILWIWIGKGKMGGWIPIGGQCADGCRVFEPPRKGRKVFELIWTVCVPSGMKLMCPGGYCEYASDGLLVDDRCRPLGPPCSCEGRSSTFRSPSELKGVGHIEPCQISPVAPDAKRVVTTKKRGRRK